MKKLLIGFFTLVLLAGLLSTPAKACFNIKYVHQGVLPGMPPVMDFTIVLQGERTPLNIYVPPLGDGIHYRFTQFMWEWLDGRTYIKWYAPVDPNGVEVDPSIGIPYCSWLYIGWELGEPPEPVILAYWTDPAGQPIPPPFGWVKQMWHDIPIPPPGEPPWLWIYYSIIEYEEMAGIDSVYYKVFQEPLPLDQLTWDNLDLWPPWDNMTELYVSPSGEPIPLPPGGSTGWEMPGVVPGDYVVFVYRGYCDNIFWDFGQHLIEGEEEPVYDLWETPEGHNTYVEFGCPTIPPIPADFFGPGSDPFDGIIALRGEPLPTSHPDDLGPTDTIVRRARAASFPECPSSDGPIETEIVALNLVSVEPITVTYDGGSPEEWDVRVCLSETAPQPLGVTNFNQVCQEGGTFTANLAVIPKLIFTPVSGGEDVYFDFGDAGQSIEYDIDDGHWQFIDSFFDVYVSPPEGVMVSNCDDVLDIFIGESAVDLIPGLQADPCNDCYNPSADHLIPITHLMEPAGCAQQDVWPPHDVVEPIPTLSEWGMIILGLLLLTAGTIAVVRRRKAALARTN